MAQQNPFLDPTNPVAPEYLDLQRRQKIAEALMSQGLDQPQGQMIGQGQFARYVAPSWTQQLAPLLKAGMGQSLASGVEKEQQQLAQQLRKQGTADVQNVLNLFRSGDKNAAIALASQSNSPQVQAIGTKLIEQQFKEPKWEKAELPQPDGSVRTGWVDLNSPQPELTFRSGGEKPAMSAKDRADLALSGQKFTFETGQQPNFGGFAISSPQGMRKDPINGGMQNHAGFDVKIPANVPLSPKTIPELTKDVGGKVLRVVPEAQSGGFGNMVEVQRQDGSIARYAHLSKVNVQPNQLVTPETIYGNPGSTGKSTGVHLHYEVKPPQGVQVASNTNMGMLSPKQQQEVVGGVAKKQAETQATGEQNALKAYDVIKKAETLLPQASSGGLQAGMTAANRFFGKSTPASQADAQLEALGSQLTLMVPRMEGPQGVLDLKLYQGAAADVANKGLPYQDRLAALDTLKDLHKKYAPNLDWSFGKEAPKGQAEPQYEYRTLPDGTKQRRRIN